MDIQRSIFELIQMEQSSVPICKKIGPSPMVLKLGGHLPKNVIEVQHKKDIGCIAVSKTLIGEPKKFRMTISDVANKMMELANLGKTVYGFRIK